MQKILLKVWSTGTGGTGHRYCKHNKHPSQCLRHPECVFLSFARKFTCMRASSGNMNKRKRSTGGIEDVGAELIKALRVSPKENANNVPRLLSHLQSAALHHDADIPHVCCDNN